MQIGLGLWLGTRQVGGFNPAAVLFSAGEQGGWYDPSDISTLFQDTAGTTPITATGQTVGLVLDKSKGLVLGPELVTNGDFSSGTTGWTVGTNLTATVVSGAVNVTRAGTITPINSFSQSTTTIAGRFYRVSIDVLQNNGAAFAFTDSGGVSYTGFNPQGFVAGVGTRTFYVFVTNTTLRVNLWTNDGTTSIFDNISVKELAGNHLTQATAASRPIYGIEPFGGRRNLLTFTEQFDNAAWTKLNATITANNATAPDGTTTADKLVENTANAAHSTSQSVTAANATYTYSVSVKASERSFCVVTMSDLSTGDAAIGVNLSNGTLFSVSAIYAPGSWSGISTNITVQGDGYYRIAVTATKGAGTSIRPEVRLMADGSTFTYTGNGTSGIFVWGAQLETGSTATAYQRVTDQWNVTQAGIPSVSYVQYDGTDDWFISPTITPGIDKAQVFAGVRKLRDTTQGAVVELSSSTALNNGAFLLAAPDADATATYGFDSKGTVQVDAVATGFATPVTSVVTGLADISGDSAIIRVNGVQADADTGDQGTGNFLAYPLYVGRRNTSPSMTLPFSGRMYQLLVRFGANLDADTIAATETFVNSKTGAYV